jgi:hypothetical protein
VGDDELMMTVEALKGGGEILHDKTEFKNSLGTFNVMVLFIMEIT